MPQLSNRQLYQKQINNQNINEIKHENKTEVIIDEPYLSAFFGWLFCFGGALIPLIVIGMAITDSIPFFEFLIPFIFTVLLGGGLFTMGYGFLFNKIVISITETDFSLRNSIFIFRKPISIPLQTLKYLYVYRSSIPTMNNSRGQNEMITLYTSSGEKMMDIMSSDYLDDITYMLESNVPFKVISWEEHQNWGKG